MKERLCFAKKEFFVFNEDTGNLDSLYVTYTVISFLLVTNLVSATAAGRPSESDVSISLFDPST